VAHPGVLFFESGPVKSVGIKNSNNHRGGISWALMPNYR
jgi:hypothetical protein